jgi:hypothetical protein
MNAMICLWQGISMAPVAFGEFGIESDGGCSVAPARRKSGDLEDPDAAIEGDRDDVAALDGAAWRRDAQPVDPYVSGRCQRGCGEAGPHDTGVP